MAWKKITKMCVKYFYCGAPNLVCFSHVWVADSDSVFKCEREAHLCLTVNPVGSGLAKHFLGSLLFCFTKLDDYVFVCVLLHVFRSIRHILVSLRVLFIYLLLF